MEFRKIALPVMAAAALGLVACGESGTTETIVEKETVVEKGGMDIVTSAADLPKCTADNEGDQVWVKEKGAASICVAGKWETLGGSGVTASDYGCETKPLADDRGVAIYCGGDSIGVVLNGKDGSDGAKGERGEQGVQGEKGVAGTL